MIMRRSNSKEWCELTGRRCEHCRRIGGKHSRCRYYVDRGMVENAVSVNRLKVCPKIL